MEIEPFKFPTLGNRLRYVRTEVLGLNQYLLGRSVGVTQFTISEFERGVTIPNAHFFKSLYEKYHISSDYLLNNCGEVLLTTNRSSESEMIRRFEKLEKNIDEKLTRIEDHLKTSTNDRSQPITTPQPISEPEEIRKEKAGERFKISRTTLNLTQLEIATTLGVSQSRIFYIESGKQYLTYDDLYTLAKVYGLNPNYLMGLETVIFKPEMRLNKRSNR